MSELISEADAHVARHPSLADCLAALRESTSATLRLIEAIVALPPPDTDVVADYPDADADLEDYMAGREPDVVIHPEPIDVTPSKEDRWIGTGEPVVEAPPVAVEGAMPPDHCVTHRANNPHCAGCITAAEVQDSWRSVTANRVAQAKAEVAAEIAAGQKPLPPGRQAFRDAKAAFDGKREPATDSQKSAITVLLDKRGIVSRPAVLAAIGEIVGRPVSSRNDLTKADASRVIDYLDAIPLPPDPGLIPPLAGDVTRDPVVSALPAADHQRPVDPVDGPPARSVEHPADGGPDGEARSDVQPEHVEPTPSADGSDDGSADDSAPPPYADDEPEAPPVDAWADGDDEFDRTRPGWRDYETGGTYAMTTTGGTDEPIF